MKYSEASMDYSSITETSQHFQYCTKRRERGLEHEMEKKGQKEKQPVRKNSKMTTKSTIRSDGDPIRAEVL